MNLFSAEAVRTYITPTVVGLMLWIIKCSIVKAINLASETYHQHLTNNANRVRDEVIGYVDKKFEDHEKLEVDCIKALQEAIVELRILNNPKKEKH